MWWSPLAIVLSSIAVASPAAPGKVTNTQPTWSPDGKWIAYTSDRDGTFAIWKTDGVRVRRVTSSGRDPAWSPDGRRIAFTAPTDGIALVPAGGGRARFVTRSGYGSEPNWAPDGRRIAFVRPPDGCADGYAIQTIRADGSNEEQVSGSSEFDGYWAPAWAPNGLSIAYVHTDGVFALERVILRTDRWQRFRGTWTRPGGPSWSPDGRFLVFTDDRTPGPRYGEPVGYGPMYVLNVRTGRRRRLVGLWGNAPAWSPGGRKIAFAAKTRDGSVQIFLVNRDGSNLVQLTKSR